jgi:hypothetical protein
MDLEHYSLLSDKKHVVYEFLSEGSKGTIRKVVYFQAIDKYTFNLAFGDWDEKTERINDKIRSNNRDKDKILATVAQAVIDFMHHHPSATVFARGSTPARTRLYQIGIGEHLDEIDKDFELDGFHKDEWSKFERGKNYEAFVLRHRKKS